MDLWLVPLGTGTTAGDQSPSPRDLAGFALRRILSLYTGLDSDSLCIERRAGGQPSLAEQRKAPLFNLSHTRGWSLIAITDVAEVGVDVERARASVDIAAITARMFGGEAAEALCQLPDADRMPSFLQSWTRFEACQKAIGQGVFAAPVETVAMQVSTFRVADDTIASVAVFSERPVRLRYFAEDR